VRMERPPRKCSRCLNPHQRREPCIYVLCLSLERHHPRAGDRGLDSWRILFARKIVQGIRIKEAKRSTNKQYCYSIVEASVSHHLETEYRGYRSFHRPSVYSASEVSVYSVLSRSVVDLHFHCNVHRWVICKCP
jgi:hypothetical protein